MKPTPKLRFVIRRVKFTDHVREQIQNAPSLPQNFPIEGQEIGRVLQQWWEDIEIGDNGGHIDIGEWRDVPLVEE